MAIRKLPSGKWRADVKRGREHAGSKVFATEREARRWERARYLAISSASEDAASRERVGVLVEVWLTERATTGLSGKTVATDRSMARHLWPPLANLPIAEVKRRHVSAWLTHLSGDLGLGAASVARYRLSLSAFFGWAVERSLIEVNPVAAARLARGATPTPDMLPLSAAEFAEVVADCRARSTFYGDIVHVLGRTGLRWGEMRALRVRDWQRSPTPAVVVARSHTETQTLKGTKSGRDRRVPVVDDVVPILDGWAAGKRQDALLVTGPDGGTLWRRSFIRALDWSTTGRGRRIHDLRHTAAIWWLQTLPLATVSHWLGHASVHITSAHYLHYLADSMERAGLEQLNRSLSGSLSGSSEDASSRYPDTRTSLPQVSPPPVP